MKTERAPYRVKGIVILAVCEDGALREVFLDHSLAERVRNTVRHRHGGNLKLYQTAMRLLPVAEKAALRPSLLARLRAWTTSAISVPSVVKASP